MAYAQASTAGAIVTKKRNPPATKTEPPPSRLSSLIIRTTLSRSSTRHRQETIGENAQALSLLQKMSKADSGLDGGGGAASIIQQMPRRTFASSLSSPNQKRKTAKSRARHSGVDASRTRSRFRRHRGRIPSTKSFYLSSIRAHTIICLRQTALRWISKSSGEDGLGETSERSRRKTPPPSGSMSDACTGHPKGSRFGALRRPSTWGRLRLQHASKRKPKVS